MDSPLNNSRFSKADSQAFRSTGTSLVFKTIGRNVKPTWSNRITKDVNDLTYNLDINLFGKNRFKSMTLEKNKISKSPGESRLNVSSRQKRKAFFDSQLSKIIKSSRSFELGKFNDQKKGKLNDLKNNKIKHLTIQTYGLCQYEFKNTIKGKMQTKPNIHLKFDNQVSHRNNVKSTWYNSEVQINSERMDSKKYRRILDKYHPFQSYTERKVFESKGKLDKIYEIQEGKRRTSPIRTKRTVPLETVPGRKQDQIKQSSYLSYQIEQGQRASLPSSPKYSIVKTEKKLVFNRQVINQRRGCYR